MTLIIPEGYSEAIFEYSLAGSSHRISTSIGFSYVGDLDGAALAVEGAWRDAFTQANMSNAYTYVGMTALGAVADAFVPGFGVGGSGTACSPPQVSALAKKVTSRRGRENRGRMYIPAAFVTDAGVGDDGSLSPTLRGSLQAQLDDFRIAVVDSTDVGNLFLLHSTALEPTPVLNLLIDPLVATQRRRLR